MYEVGGFKLLFIYLFIYLFIFFSVLNWVILIAVMFILPKKWRHKAIEDEKRDHLSKYLKNPWCCNAGICTLTGGTLILFFNSTIAV